MDIFFKVPADYEIPYHWHTSAERMILVSGNLEVTYDNQKGEPCILFIAFEEPLDAHEIMTEQKPFK